MLSPLSPLRRYVAIISWDSDRGGIEAFVIDTKNKRIIAKDDAYKKKAPIPSFAAWVSWSPDERYALISPGGEGIRELMYLDLKTGISKEIPLKRFAKNYNGAMMEMQLTEIDSVKWINNHEFTTRIGLYCNPFDDAKCQGDKPRRVYKAKVDINTLSIKYNADR